MREIRTSGSEGGGAEHPALPTPITGSADPNYAQSSTYFAVPFALGLL